MTALDYMLAHGLFPFASRFPVGFRFQHDLTRFLGRPPKLIVDVGANIGQSALWYAHAWPAAEVHSFEPVRSTYAELVRRCASFPKIHCYQRALGESPGTVTIQLQTDSELNSLLAPVASPSSAEAEVIEVQRLDAFFMDQRLGHIDLLKIDAEGVELQVLAGAGELLRERKVRAVLAECRFMRTPARQVLFEDLDRELSGQGFLFAGFYDCYRFGHAKSILLFGNGLWLLKPEANPS